ncbi:Clp protease N-terminal domain-containing protein [Thermogemmatispora sp.]|uniref:Clp protease N-terminal domain-containing protein n=1 Tax=Thermogemmatispora sp. TaxID=1968838 RepID=UPI001E0A226F|nr:Clp protease N-terminal domain-containing protein [Thermogemmatispora sp.]MBX5451495.1 hypothetical protein [Thermogemmatispora sp.]
MLQNRFLYFTSSARSIFKEAQQSAESYQQTYVAPEHFLIGITSGKATTASRLLNKLEVDPSRLKVAAEQAIADQLASHPDFRERWLGLTEEAKRVVELAVDEASQEQLNFVGSEHVLLALLRQRGTLASEVLEKVGISLERARAKLQSLRREGHLSEP